MKHTPKRLFAADNRGLDLVIISNYAIKHGDNGPMISNDAAANFLFVHQEGNVFIHRVELFTVSTSLRSASQKLSEVLTQDPDPLKQIMLDV